ncbi:MAG: hypothetical protein ACE5I1_31075, partial [bacterium]
MKNVIKKLSNSLFLLALVWVLNITLLYLSPGDATDRYWGPQTDRAILQGIKEARGLHLPYHKQVFLWTKRLLHGDLGYSWMHHRPVWEVLIEAAPATLLLGAAALAITLFLGSIIGALSAIYAGKNFGRLLNYSGLAVYSTPIFCLAILGIYFFSVQFKLLPGS